MKSGVPFFLVLLVLAFLDVRGCRRAGSWLVRDDSAAHADVMVLLMGDFSDRVLQAGDLYAKGTATRLLIVRESMGPYRKLQERGANVIRTTTQAHDAAVALGIPADSITVLPGDARSTLDEALAVKEYLSGRRETDTVLLVSSAPHMRRATIIFRSVLRYPDRKIQVLASPSRYSDFNARHWWKDREDIQDVLSELIKIGAFQTIERGGL